MSQIRGQRLTVPLTILAADRGHRRAIRRGHQFKHAATLSNLDVAMPLQGFQIAALDTMGAPQPETTYLNGGAAYYRIYATRDDRHVMLGAVEQKFWRCFCEAAGRPDWMVRQNEPLPQTALIADVAALFASRDAKDWEATLGPIDCCFGAIMEPRDVPGHPQIAARGMVARQGGPDAMAEALFPAHVDGVPPTPRQPPAMAKTDAVLSRWVIR